MEISEAQLQAIHHHTGSAMVLAGPGSGKTTVITRRVQALIEEDGVDPMHILTITFSKAAAIEMEQRFKVLTGDRYRTTFGTFHGIFFRMLRYAYRYDASNIIREDHRMLLVRRIVEELDPEREGRQEFAEDILNEISLVKNNRLDLAKYYSESCSGEKFREIYQAYETALRQQNKIDFDDMLTMTWELLSERRDILAGWQGRYRYILVDEFQDINQVQYDIVRLLAGERANLFIVGDDDQSIYRFRGAKPEIMLNFGKDYPNAVQYLLTTNYRSTERIVRAAGKVIAHNKKRYPKDIKAVREAGEKLVLSRCKNPRQQASRILHKMRQYREQGCAWKDMAVLYRANLDAATLMEQMMYANVPMRTKEGMPNLFEHWIARDLMCYLRLAKGDRTRNTFLQVMNRPNRYISRDALAEQSVDFDKLRWFYRNKEWMVERLTMMEFHLNQMAKMKPAAAVRYLRETVGYDAWLQEYAEKQKVRPEEWLEMLDALQESMTECETAEEWFYYIEDYTEKWKEQQERSRENLQNGEDCVTLTTMHGAKGLEFRIVFLIGANEGITPHRKAKQSADIEEERRLFYVAMTRAKDILQILFLEEQYQKQLEISRFVEEIRK